MLFIIFIIIFLSFLCYILYKKTKIVHTINEKIIEINREHETKNAILRQQEEDLKKTLDQMSETIKKMYDSYPTAEELSSRLNEARDHYFTRLEQEYKEREEEYDRIVTTFGTAFEKKQDALLAEMDVTKAELDKIKSTRAAAMEAALREKKIEDDLSFYTITIAQLDLDDIKVLDRIKDKLHKPRVLCMLIWSTYYRDAMTRLCNNVLGAKTVCGIYKITNTNTKECYIGQAVDIATRFKTHAKCGLGIDTPANNSLYKAMQEEGLYAFSWELIEECSRELLNEKESYYIDLYDSCKYGYNSTKGNK